MATIRVDRQKNLSRDRDKSVPSLSMLLFCVIWCELDASYTISAFLLNRFFFVLL